MKLLDLKFFYRTTTNLFVFFLPILSLFSKKISKAATVRKDMWKTLQLQDRSQKRAWFHCASHGEFEQIFPLIMPIRKQGYSILVSFFSPSGYRFVQPRKNKFGIDTVCYLPFDTSKNAKAFLKAVEPSLIIWTKNEFWWNFFEAIRGSKVPAYLVAASFRNEQLMFRRKSRFFTENLRDTFLTLFTVDKASTEVLMKGLGINSVTAGDPKIDSVLPLAKENPHRNKIVYGSAWCEDLPVIKLMIEAFPEMQHRIYPHQIDEENVQQFNKELMVMAKANIKIVATMGELKYAYQEAQYAYVGGGFSDGIHNVLEPAAQKIPVLIGPNFQKSSEARKLEQKGLLQVVRKSTSKDELKRMLSIEKAEMTSNGLDHYFEEHSGATDFIINSIFAK